MSYRPEARKRSYAEMISTEQEVFRSLLNRLNGAVEAARSDDGELRSSVFWVSGERGTGKTTMLHSLRYACETPNSFLLTNSELNDDEKERLKCLGLQLTFLGSHLQWLPELDLETLPKTVNLLVAVLVRIQAVVEEHFEGDDAGERHQDRQRSLLASRAPKAVRDFDQFVRTVAQCWNGNLDARASQLDGESYGVAAQRAERARLELRKLGDKLDALAKTMVARAEEAPVFLLPIDDADLNPQRLHELLHLLLLVRSPRLLFLVMSHPTDPEQVLADGFLGELITLRGGRAIPKTLRDRSEGLAAKAMRKVFPAIQRWELRNLSPVEALSVQLPARRSPTQGTLRDVFRSVPLPQPPDDIPRKQRPSRFTLEPCTTLLDFLLVPAPNRKSTSSELLSWASPLLRSPMRALLDLGTQLQSLSASTMDRQSDEYHHALLRFIGDGYVSAIRESELPPEQRNALLSAWSSQYHWFIAKQEVLANSGEVKVELHALPIHIFVRKPPRLKVAERLVIDEAVLGWFVLLHDFATALATTDLGAVTASLTAPSDVYLSTHTHRKPFWVGGPWTSFIEHNIFAVDWTQAVEAVVSFKQSLGLDAESEQRAIDFLLLRRIAAIISVSGQRKPFLAATNGEFEWLRTFGLPCTPEQLQRLTSWIAQQLDLEYGSIPRSLWLPVLGAVYCLLAPEALGSISIAIAFRDALNELWERYQPQLTSYRQEVYRSFPVEAFKKHGLEKRVSDPEHPHNQTDPGLVPAQ